MMSSSKLSLATKVPAKLWNQYAKTQHDSDMYTTGLSPMVLGESKEDVVNPEDLATLMLHSVFSSVCSETGIIRSDDDIYHAYAQQLVDRISRGIDTGLAHRDILPMWNMLKPKEQEESEKLLFDAVDGLDGFPDVSAMNIVHTGVDGVIDARIIDIPVFIPATVATSGGIAAIIPSINGAGWRQSALSFIGGSIGGHITQWHVWDIENSKVTAISGEPFEKFLDSLGVVL